MPKKRMLETADERSERLRKKALIAIEEATTAEDALDRMVKRSIRLYGP